MDAGELDPVCPLSPPVPWDLLCAGERSVFPVSRWCFSRRLSTSCGADLICCRRTAFSYTDSWTQTVITVGRKKSFLFSALYAACILGGRHVMKQREKFELRKPLVLWSLTLAVFSIFGAVRTGSYMMFILMSKGLKQSVCDQSFYNGPVSKFWAYAFVLSKAPELGDTLFIVLRKQKLIFLHWYHHITVLLYSWYSYKDMVAGGGWFMTMNYLVHAVMYSYYALRAAGFKVSRKFAMFITLTQITQMLMGCVVNYLVYSWMQQGQECPSHMQNIVWSSLMYLSYFVLFVQFFYEAYVGKSNSSAKTDVKKSK
uniref:Elongation of very long chain fatty acids protein n=2 Tax=Poeciliinae TaxID=586240 RepID=A0A3P9P0R9_POERE